LFNYVRHGLTIGVVKLSVMQVAQRTGGTDHDPHPCTDPDFADPGAEVRRDGMTNDTPCLAQTHSLREALKEARSSFVYHQSFGSCEQSCNEAIASIDAALALGNAGPITTEQLDQPSTNREPK
jgi:hypothetical protein